MVSDDCLLQVSQEARVTFSLSSLPEPLRMGTRKLHSKKTQEKAQERLFLAFASLLISQ
jgi:hypothetical protein